MNEIDTNKELSDEIAFEKREKSEYF